MIEGFFAASCDFGPNYSVGRETLYLRFSEWVRGRSHQQPISIAKFKDQILVRFKEEIKEVRRQRKGKQNWLWEGVQLRSEDRQAAAARKSVETVSGIG